MQALLKKTLQAAGFQTAETPAAADGRLSVEFCGSITLDWDEWDPTYPRPAYCFKLTSATGEQLWHAQIYVGKGQRVEGELREAALICARKLSSARKKSAHKAGR